MSDHVESVGRAWRESGFDPFTADSGENDFGAVHSKTKPKAEKARVEGSSSVRSTRAFSTKDTRSERSTRDKAKADWLRSLPVTSWKVISRAAELGRTGKLSEPEFCTWKLRVAIEEAVLTPAPVAAAPLPDGYDDAARKVYGGFVFLLGCKWLYTPGEPTVFSREFAAPWCEVSVRQAREAITALKRDGFLLPVGKHGRSTVWLPGS